MPTSDRRQRFIGLDCQTCGACCTNPDENRREGFVDYVEVETDGPLLKRPDRARRYVVHNADGVPHLRLEQHRCAALRGTLGRNVHCVIYAHRPLGCRRIDVGGDRCLQYRRERGIDE